MHATFYSYLRRRFGFDFLLIKFRASALMIANFEFLDLRGVSIPDDLRFNRSLPNGQLWVDQGDWKGYDVKTLFYCAFRDEQSRTVSLFGPPLFNFSIFLDGATFLMNGHKLLSKKLHYFVNFFRLDLFLTPNCQCLTIEVFGTKLALEIQAVNKSLFKNLNVVYTMQRNNDLAWIYDWLLWNHRTHKADAVLLVDNQSDRYSLDELAEIVLSVPGYRAVQLVRSPFSYGPFQPESSSGLYLQTAMMNAFRHQSLKYSTSFLNIDIDELIFSKSQVPIFDAIQKSLLGLILFRGYWRYSDSSLGYPRHSSHYYRRSVDKTCPPKYCIRSRSIASHFGQLKIHHVGSFRQIRLISSNDYFYFHCRSISTAWKYDRSILGPGEMALDKACRDRLLSFYSTNA